MPFRGTKCCVPGRPMQIRPPNSFFAGEGITIAPAFSGWSSHRLVGRSMPCSDQLFRQQLDRVAHGEPAALYHLGMHAQFHVAIKLAELVQRPGITLRRLGIHLRRSASGDRPRDPQHGAPRLQLLTNPGTLAPGACTAEPDIGTKPPTMAPCANLLLVVTQAGQVDQADHLPPLIAEAVTRHMMEPRLPPRLITHERSKKFANSLTPCLGQSI